MSGAITATVLFTDLVGSTELLSRVGEEAAEELRREHFGLLRGALIAHGGREVKNLGDGLMVVFDGVTAALACGVAMQQSIDLRNRGHSEQLSVRVAVTHGEADVEDGDYFGVPVVEAARLCGRAGGGEILITELVRLLAGTRGGFEFEARGQMDLKGLDSPVSACAVVWTRRTRESVALPARLEAPEGSFLVGRSAELAMLSESLKHADETLRRRVTFLAGEAGIGKTTLVSTFARAARDADAIVLYGRCDEDLLVPYQPWVEALAHLVACAPDALLAAHVKERGGDLGALVPGLAARIPNLPAGRASDPETERHLLFGAVVDLLVRASANGPVVLVLDDLHWSDRPTLQLLRYVTGATVEMRLLVLGTFRDADVGAGHPLADLLAACHREDGVDRIALPGLDDHELLALLEATAGHEMDETGVSLRDGLRTETNGNPFFALEILRHLAETGAIAQGDDGRWTANVDLRTHGLPVSVREVVGRRIERLAPDATRVLSAAATIGRDFDVGLLAEVTETSEADLLDLLDLADQADIVTEAPGGEDRYTFVHALIQHTLYDDLSAARRRRLHRRVGEALESLSSGPGERVTELARHWYEATQPTDVPKAYKYSLAAGEQAQDRLAPDEAVRWFNQALELVDRLGQDSDTARCDVLIRLGDAQRLAGDAAFRETLLDAAALARRMGDTDRLAAAALANHRGREAAAGEVDAERVEVLAAALDGLDATDTTRRAQLLATLAVELTYSGDLERVTALADEAVALARQLGDPATLISALSSHQAALRLPETLAARLDTTRQAVALADRLGDPWLQFRAHMQRIQAAVESGDRGERDGGVAACHDIATQVGEPFLQVIDAQNRATQALLDGDPARAETLADEAFALGTESGQPDALTLYGAQLLELRVHQGRAREIVDAVAEGLHDNPGLPALRAGVARAFLEADRPGDARALLEASSIDLPYDELWLIGNAMWALVVARLGERELAEVLFERLTPWAGQIPNGTLVTQEPIDHCLGELAAALGRTDVAHTHFIAAEATARRFGAPFYLAHTLLERARLDAAHDPDAATARATEALTIASNHGYARLERDAAGLLAAG